VVPGYRVDEVLGRGAGGPVWRAWPTDPLVGRPAGSRRGLGGGRDEGGEEPPSDGRGPVAVKIVPGGPGAAQELALLRAVHHPFVVPLLDSVVLEDGSLALVLVLVEGGSLRSLVAARGSLTAGEVVTVLSPLARTLADLHSRGIQHGDVAPGNVLLDRSGRPLLSDLGTVRITGAGRDEVFGTAGYVDPVVLAGGMATPASDVYGLGAVGWFALAGEPPPAAPLRPRLAELVPSAPAALVEAVEAAVDPDPARRPEPLDLARAVHGACRPAPLWRWRAGPDDGGLTRRVVAMRTDRASREESWGQANADGFGDLDGFDEGTGEAKPQARHRADRPLLRRLLMPGPRGLGFLVVAGALLAGLWLAAGPVRTWTAGLVQAGAGAPDRPGTAASRGPTVPSTRTSARERLPAVPPVAGSSRSRPQSSAARSSVGGQPRDGPHGDLAAAGTARAVVQELTARRAAALGSPRSQGLGSTTLPGSAAAVADTAARRSLLATGLSYRRLVLSVRDVSVVVAGADEAVVRATTDASGYDVVDASGRLRYRVPPRRGSPALLHLVRTARGWRVRAVTAP
jgi:serine/threonine protein kinase